MTVASAAASGCRVMYTVTNSWQGGFGANVDVTNLGDPVNGWTLAWTFPAGQAVTQAWNATVTTSGGQTRATDAGYNAPIGTGATVSFGFNASWTGSNPAPTAFTLNGVACTGAATPSQSASASPSASTSPPPPAGNAKQMEDLDRGLISVRSGSGNLVSWRLLGTEALATPFNLYRGGTRVATVTAGTDYLDSGAAADASYTVRAVVGSGMTTPPAPVIYVR